MQSSTRQDASPAPSRFTTYDAAAIPAAARYKLFTSTIVPRPIAWVSTVDAEGVRNLAPFSFFTGVSSEPPVLCFCATNREAANGLPSHKDTLANIRATGEFVVNIVSEDTADAMNRTAAQLLPQEDEFLHAGLTALESEAVRPARVGEARVAMECRLRQIVEVGQETLGSSVIFGDVLRFHIREDLYEKEFYILPERLQAVGRLAGSDYVHTTERFSLDRPK